MREASSDRTRGREGEDMGRQILGICDKDQKYVAALTERISRKKTADFDLRAFTDPEALMEFSKRERMDLVLIGEDLASEELLQLFSGRILLLTGKRQTEKTSDDPKERCCGRIYKYQASSEIVRKMLETLSEKKEKDDRDDVISRTGIYDDSRGGTAAFLQKPETVMLGVFSPCAPCAGTAFAMALALQMQKKKPTLFLSFECFSGWKAYLPALKHAAGSLADGIYYLRNGNLKVAHKLLASEQKIGELSFLPPFPDPQDLFTVTDEEWRTVLRSLRNETGFEAIVTDLGMVPAFCPAVLLNFSAVCIPEAENDAERAKTKEFQNFLKKNMLDVELRDRIRTAAVGGWDIPRAESNWAEQLLYGEIGKAAQKLTEGV